MRKNLRDIVALIRFIAARFAQDRCAETAASLTFTTLLSLVPMITIALTVFSAFPVFEDFSAQIKSFLMQNLMPENAGKIITRYMQQFAESATHLTTMGVLFLAVTAMLMMLTIDKAFNVIWRVSRPRPLVKRLIVYWAVLTLAPLLIGASLSLTSWLVGLSLGYARHIPLFGLGVLKILPVLFTTMAFALMFRLVPNRHVPRAHALTGAIVAAIVFEFMNRMFGYYISHFPTYKLVYGAFASVPIFLMWIYLSWLSILLGAVISASLSHWRVPSEKNLTPADQLLDALRILKILSKCLEQGRVATLPELSKSLYLGYDVLENILERLASVDIVRKAQGEGWLLMRSPSHIRVSELSRVFVLDGDSLLTEQNGDPLQQWLVSYAGQLEQIMDATLQDLFSRSPA